jgi:septal ring factor EnvC (AmiA/AmiB activator)
MRRVVDILVHKQQGIISDLVAAGMDPQDWTFCSDSYNHYYPGQYITHLKNEIEWEQDEREGAEQKIEDLKDQLKKLSLRTVTELLKQAQDTIDNAEASSRHAIRDAEKARQENRELKEKLGMWNVLATE